MSGSLKVLYYKTFKLPCIVLVPQVV